MTSNETVMDDVINEMDSTPDQKVVDLTNVPLEEVQEIVEPKKKWKKKEVVEELPPPPAAPERVKKSVTIGWKVYTLDSDNSDLLKKLDWGKKKDEKWNRVEVQYDYLPIGTILQLMDWLFDQYDFYSEQMVYTGEEYSVAKKVYDPKSKTRVDSNDTVRVYEKKVKIIVTTVDYNFGSVVREVTWYAQWVASTKQLTSDPSRNGFVNKLWARARKEALKNLGRVFRVTDEDSDDADVINEEVQTASKPKSTPAPVKKAEDVVNNALDTIAVDEMYEKFIADLKRTNENFFETEWTYTLQNLTAVLMWFKKDKWIVAGTPSMDAFKKIYNELSVKASDYWKE